MLASGIAGAASDGAFIVDDPTPILLNTVSFPLILALIFCSGRFFNFNLFSKLFLKITP
jgi:hypothetical protein